MSEKTFLNRKLDMAKRTLEISEQQVLLSGKSKLPAHLAAIIKDARSTVAEVEKQLAEIEPADEDKPISSKQLERMERNIEDTQKLLDDTRRELAIAIDQDSITKRQTQVKRLEEYLQGLIDDYGKAGGNSDNYTV